MKNDKEVKMKQAKYVAIILILLLAVFGLTFFSINIVYGAYHHMGEIDSGIFLSVYTDKVGTKLDSCTVCHSGGSYQSGGKTVSLGSCQWCHYKYGYDAHGNIDDTLNSYGMAYKGQGEIVPQYKPLIILTLITMDTLTKWRLLLQGTQVILMIRLQKWWRLIRFTTVNNLRR